MLWQLQRDYHIWRLQHLDSEEILLAMSHDRTRYPMAVEKAVRSIVARSSRRQSIKALRFTFLSQNILFKDDLTLSETGCSIWEFDKKQIWSAVNSKLGICFKFGGDGEHYQRSSEPKIVRSTGSDASADHISRSDASTDHSGKKFLSSRLKIYEPDMRTKNFLLRSCSKIILECLSFA